jgi:hypothetical protein
VDGRFEGEGEAVLGCCSRVSTNEGNGPGGGAGAVDGAVDSAGTEADGTSFEDSFEGFFAVVVGVVVASERLASDGGTESIGFTGSRSSVGIEAACASVFDGDAFVAFFNMSEISPSLKTENTASRMAWALVSIKKAKN